MGVEYYVVNKRDKTIYDLGKGGWYALSKDLEAFQDLEYLTHFIIYECYSRVFDDDNNFYSEEEKDEIRKYVSERVAPDLFAFANGASPNDLEVFNDCGDEITICRALKYQIIGTRYYEKGSKEYIDSLDFANRHLYDSNSHFYRPEHFENYPYYIKLLNHK